MIFVLTRNGSGDGRHRNGYDPRPAQSRERIGTGDGMGLGGDFPTKSSGSSSTSGGGYAYGGGRAPFTAYLFSLPASCLAGIIWALFLLKKSQVDGGVQLLIGVVAGVVWFYTPFAKEKPLAHFAVTLVAAAVGMALQGG